MSLLSWPNQPFKLFIFSCLLQILIFGASSSASDFTEENGLIGNLEELSELKTENFKEVLKQINLNPRNISDLVDLESMDVDPYFMQALIFFSPRRYVNLIATNPCNIVPLLENQLLTTGGLYNQPSLPVRLTRKGNKYESSIVTLKDFFEYKYKNGCFSNREIRDLFELSKVKTTVNSIKLTTPESESDCMEIVDQWKVNPYTPYLCKIGEVVNKGFKASQELKGLKDGQAQLKRTLRRLVREAKDYRGELTAYQLEYLKNMCMNLDKPKKFCEKYLSDNFWNKVLNGEKPLHHLSTFCPSVLNKKKLSRADYIACASKINSDATLCQTSLDLYPRGMFPRPNCEALAKALQNSRLISDYTDCPENVRNSAVTNTHRIYRHFKKTNLSEDPLHCASKSMHHYAKINMQNDNEAALGAKFCYNDFLKEEEVCLPGFLGEYPGSEYSASRTVEKIMGRLRSDFSDSKCTFVSEDRYNPALLAYKRGCLIVFDQDTCNFSECNFKIIYNEKEVNKIQIKGSNLQDYFPEKYSRAQYSLKSILEKEKIFKSKNLKNMTDIKTFFNQHERGVIHGVVCQEAVFPQFFKNRFINFCTPMGIIVDGFFQIKYKSYMIVRAPFDRVQVPRIVPWGYLYSGLVEFSTKHSLETWPLNGVF